MPLAVPPELLALAGALLIGLSHVITKHVIGLVPAAIFLPLRWSVSAAMLALLITAVGEWANFRWTPEIVFLLAGGTVGPVIAWSLYARALSRIDVSIGYSVSQTSTIGGIGLAVLLLGERPGPYIVLGAVLVVIGVSLLYGRPDQWRQSRISRSGMLLVAGAAVAWSMAFVFWKLSLNHFTIFQVILVRSALPALVTAAMLAASARGETPALLGKALNGRALLIITALSFICDVAAWGFQFMALRLGTVGTIMPISGSSPLFVVLFSVLLIHERLNRWSIVGVLLIAAGIAAVVAGK